LLWENVSVGRTGPVRRAAMPSPSEHPRCGLATPEVWRRSLVQLLRFPVTPPGERQQPRRAHSPERCARQKRFRVPVGRATRDHDDGDREARTCPDQLFLVPAPVLPEAPVWRPWCLRRGLDQSACFLHRRFQILRGLMVPQPWRSAPVQDCADLYVMQKQQNAALTAAIVHTPSASGSYSGER
jgi:hypothetical protein